jgi:mannose-6-phosphate isomerase-like protein (cupin superfamily)
MIKGKIWGTTEPVIVTPMFEAHRLRIKPNFQCSIHRHERKANAFLVVQGVLHIDVGTRGVMAPELLDTTTLYDWMEAMTTVPAGLWHRFRTGNVAAVAYEFYFPEVLGADDIARYLEGGPV